jgi:hypothetical protein
MKSNLRDRHTYMTDTSYNDAFLGQFLCFCIFDYLDMNTKIFSIFALSRVEKSIAISRGHSSLLKTSLKCSIEICCKNVLFLLLLRGYVQSLLANVRLMYVGGYVIGANAIIIHFHEAVLGAGVHACVQCRVHFSFEMWKLPQTTVSMLDSKKKYGKSIKTGQERGIFHSRCYICLAPEMQIRDRSKAAKGHREKVNKYRWFY